MSDGAADSLILRAMRPDDAEAVIALWQRTDGLSVHPADDNPESLGRFIARNEGLSSVVADDGTVVGCVLCGTDGRRGYLYHMAVAESHRRRGLARRMTEASLAALRGAGVRVCFLFVFNDNTAGRAFWKSCGFVEPTNYGCMAMRLTDPAD